MFSNNLKMTNEFSQLAAEFTDKLVHAFAARLASHTLSKNMSADEIIDLIGYVNLVQDEEPVEEIEITKAELPEGLGLGRAKNIIKLCQRGVSDGEYVHTTSQKIIIPTEQHIKMYRNEKSKLIGPQKDKDIIDFLAKKIGEVGVPKEEENAVAKLPSTWNAKNVDKLKKMVEECPSDKMINAFSSRAVEYKATKMVKCEDLRICAPRTEKGKFHSLVAYLREQEDWKELELSDAVSPAKKGKAVAKGKAKKTDDDDTEEQPVKKSRKTTKKEEKSKGGRKAKEEPVEDKKPAKRGAKKVVEEPDETDDTQEDDEMKDDGTASDDSDDDEERDSDALDYDRIKQAREKLKEGEYINVHNCKPVNKTAELSKTHMFSDDEHFCVKKEHSDRACKALMSKITNMLADED